jgi:hypothetical protein
VVEGIFSFPLLAVLQFPQTDGTQCILCGAYFLMVKSVTLYANDRFLREITYETGVAYVHHLIISAIVYAFRNDS